MQGIAVAARSWARGGLDSVPWPVGAALARLPWRLRLGAAYEQHQRIQDAWDGWSDHQRHEWLVERLTESVARAELVPHYRRQWGTSPDSRTFDDLHGFSTRIPLCTKDELRLSSLGERAVPGAATGRLLNTGGTSGSPLSFHVEPAAWAREWAHMGRIWNRVGWTPGEARLTVRGHNLGDSVLQYRASHHEFVLNTFAPPASWADSLDVLFRSGRAPTFVHGYPSSVFMLVRELQHDSTGRRVLSLMRQKVKAVFLGSEFPAERLREEIENELAAVSQSWYGHSEMAALAVEEPSQRYRALQTYGYMEALPIGDDTTFRLVATGFWNSVAPLIRYDTGDVIAHPRWSAQGVLESFEIHQGRGSDFIVDRDGRPIPLTALIFGRHHRAFDILKSVQVRQVTPGKICLVCVPLPNVNPLEIRAGFDMNGVDITYDIEIVSRPIRVQSGKAPLLLGAQSS